MIKKTITYDDFDGNPKTEDFYFHLTKAELLEQNLVHGEGYGDYLKQIAQQSEAKKVLPIFKEMIALCVGYQDEERRFVKSTSFAQSFMASEAYSELFFEFIGNVQSFIDFVNGVMPKGFADQIDLATGELKATVEEATSEPRKVQVIELPSEKKYEDFTEEELLVMPQTLFDQLTGGDPRNMTRDQMLMAMARSNRNTTKEG